jgi:hypothetical protein
MKRTVWLMFTVFCLLSSAAWLIPVPIQTDTALEQHGLLYLVTALILLAFEHRVGWLLDNWRQWFWLGILGTALLGLPAVLADLVAGGISAFTVAAIFALLPIPVILVLLQQDSNSDQPGDIQRFFAPTFIAITGLLFLIPAHLPHSTRGIYLLLVTCLCLIIVAFASVHIYSRLQAPTIPRILIVILFSNGCFQLAASVITGHFSPDNLHPSVLLSLPNSLYLTVNILLILLSRSFTPLPLSTRYLLISFLSIVEGLVLLRPNLTLRMGCGLLLMLSGLIWFFATPKSEETYLGLH